MKIDVGLLRNSVIKNAESIDSDIEIKYDN